MDINAPEKEYLEKYPDVNAAVQQKWIASGFEHYVRHGRAEGRSYSSLQDFGNVLDGVFGIVDNAPISPKGSKIVSRLIEDYLVPTPLSKMMEVLRLLGLADALKTTGLPSLHGDKIRVLSVGSGEGKHEAVLAGRFPGWEIVATDLSIPAISAETTDNLEFRLKNILEWPEKQDFDFVYSIECLEHIKEYPLAFRHISSKVRQGGWLYLSVPFANPEEQADEQLRKSEWDNHQHYVPGFSNADLIGLCQANGLTPVGTSAIFHPEPRISLDKMLNAINRDYFSILPHLVAILALDVQWDHIPANRSEAVGIRILAKKC